MNRQIHLDYIKSIAIFFVLVYHCHTFGDNIMIAAVLSMCCPLFFVVNGGLLLQKNRGYEYYFPKLIKLYILTLVWGIFSNVMISVIHHEPYSIKQCILDVLNLRLGYCNHLWFMCTLFILYCIYPLLNPFIKKKNTTYILLAIFVVFTLFFGGINTLIIGNFSPLKGWHSYALAYAIGGYAIKQIKVKSKLYLFIVFIIAMIGQVIFNYFELYQDSMIFFGYRTPFVFVATLSLVKLFSYCKFPRNRLIDFIANNTLGIYLIHWVMTIYISTQYFTNLYRYFLPIFVLLFSGLICWAMNKNKYTKWFISI